MMIGDEYGCMRHGGHGRYEMNEGRRGFAWLASL